MLEALQNSAFSQWLLVSEYGYPIFLTLHSLGLAMLVGVLICIDLRILGIARSIPLPRAEPGWAGLSDFFPDPPTPT